MAQHLMLARYLRDYPGDLDQYCKGILQLCDFSGIQPPLRVRSRDLVSVDRKCHAHKSYTNLQIHCIANHEAHELVKMQLTKQPILYSFALGSTSKSAFFCSFITFYEDSTEIKQRLFALAIFTKPSNGQYG